MRSPNGSFRFLMVMLAVVALLGWGGARAAAETVDFSAFTSSECALTGAVADADLSFLDDQATATTTTTAAPPPDYGAGKACKTNKQCGKGMWCEKADGDCKGEGKCMKKMVCTDLVVAPVCGCNHRNYKSKCMAHAAGVNVAHDGKCKKGEK